MKALFSFHLYHISFFSFFSFCCSCWLYFYRVCFQFMNSREIIFETGNTYYREVECSWGTVCSEFSTQISTHFRVYCKLNLPNLWSGYQWKGLLPVPQISSARDAKSGQKWWRQKWYKGRPVKLPLWPKISLHFKTMLSSHWVTQVLSLDSKRASVYLQSRHDYTQSKRPLDKNQSSKFCQSSVKQTHFRNFKEKRKGFFDHRGTLRPAHHRRPRSCLWFTYVTVLRYVLSHLRECMKMVRKSL